MNNYIKIALIGLVLLYIVSPVDLAPGPLDDLIVLLLGVASTKAIPTKAKTIDVEVDE